jgi:hypothetical protein
MHLLLIQTPEECKRILIQLFLCTYLGDPLEATAPDKPLVVGVERLPPAGPDVGGCHRDGEEDGGEQNGPAGIETGEKAFPRNKVDGGRDRERDHRDEGSVQPAAGGGPVAGGHAAEVEREGCCEHEQGGWEGGGPDELEPEEPGEYRREYPEYREEP